MFENFSTYIESSLQITLSMVFLALIGFSIAFATLKKVMPNKDFSQLIARTNSWYLIYAIIFLPLLTSKVLFLLVISFISFTAFRELITLVGFNQHSRPAVFLCYACIPVQFALVYAGYTTLSLAFIPVMMLITISFRMIVQDQVSGILDGFSKSYWCLMISVFNLSHIPMLLSLEKAQGGKGLVVFLFLISQINDIFQFLWGKALGKRLLLQKISPNKTWEGFLGGLVSSVALSWLIAPITPLSATQAMLAGAVIASLGLVGDLCISAVKRAKNKKDASSLIPGHGGMSDRVDSLIFSSVVFYYLSVAWL